MEKQMEKYTIGKQGALIVLEGPDGIGKTTIANELTAILKKRGFPAVYYSFPGKEKNTLGSLVYQLHHNSQTFGINYVDPVSLQLLHIAAHLDCISARILPSIFSGYHVVLDRYWWSTFVYGIAGGIDKSVLASMIEVEEAALEYC